MGRIRVKNNMYFTQNIRFFITVTYLCDIKLVHGPQIMTRKTPRQVHVNMHK